MTAPRPDARPGAAPKILPLDPPRPYRLRDACCGRVWRSAPGALGRELGLIGLAMAGVSLVRDDLLLRVAGLGLLALGALLAIGGCLLTNVRRARLVREAPAFPAVLGHPRRVLLLHELFRIERERTFILPYVVRLPDGTTREGRVWICGCARQYLLPGTEEPVAVDPADPRRTLPLRLAVMVVPH